MSNERIMEALITALKRARADGEEHRLIKVGRHDGLFPGRTSINGEAANRALREGLLEVTRAEDRGKTRVEWARITPAGIAFLDAHESPLRVLEDLRASLQLLQQGVPLWFIQAQQQWKDMGQSLVRSVEELTRKLDDALQRIDAVVQQSPSRSPQPDPAPAKADWTNSAIDYLDQRRRMGQLDECPLSELFHAISSSNGSLTLKEFHDGLRRLRDRHAVELLEFVGEPTELPEPEYALVDSARVFCHVVR